MANPEQISYLGDGAYAFYDGYGIELRANHHEFPTDRVTLEPLALVSLLRFAKSVGMIQDPPVTFVVNGVPYDV